MPELPEVETVRRTLEELIVGKKIAKVKMTYPKIIKEPKDTLEFSLNLVDEVVETIGRKGKFLIIYTTNYALVSHLRMEGKFLVAKKEEEFDKHTHVFFEFEDGFELRYRDVRKFGTMHLYLKGTEFDKPPLVTVGVEANTESFKADELYNKLRKISRPIKSVLLDQTIVSGLGNIYVDEVLFRAKIHPSSSANKLTLEEIEKIVNASKEVLNIAIEKGGTTIRSYLNAQGKIGAFQEDLLVYGKSGEPCSYCQREIQKTRVAGRGTSFCITCQELKK
ncbi:MAG: 5-hydroxymethyluracil glycosylase [Bacillales bacterium]|jgi:formamidopyrimidine-DNA glycosylase|nr:5-hydroxymethyluracil glycosylase [Bacillales bacterium]